MRLQYQLSGLAECSSCGPNLQQDINAVAILLEHVGDAFHLPSDTPQPSEDLLLAWVIHHDNRNLCVLNPNTVWVNCFDVVQQGLCRGLRNAVLTLHVP